MLKRTPKDKAAVKRQVLSVVYEDELLVREHEGVCGRRGRRR